MLGTIQPYTEIENKIDSGDSVSELEKCVFLCVVIQFWKQMVVQIT